VSGDVPSKRCSTCGETKALDQFNRLERGPFGRQYACRDCNRRYHQEHKSRHNAQIRARSLRVRAEITEWLREYLCQHPCADCGEDDPVVLEFDHLRDKIRNVSGLVRRDNLSAVQREVEKCEVVCANCHRRRTYERQGSVRSTWRRARERRIDGAEG
jgi:protein-arginine kinase activator protein McsA